MSKPEVSIILPSMSPLEEITAYKTFVNSDWHEKIDVQFVYLRNGIEGGNLDKARIEQFDTHELIYVPHKFFIATAEENIYRLQDFTDLLRSRLFIVGNDDEIEWDMLVEALAYWDEHELDAMGLQWGFKQLRSNGTYSTLPILAPNHIPCEAYNHIASLMSGQPLDSYIAFATLLSLCGPLHWPTYIGNQMFSREVFQKLMQYRGSDPLCSHVFMHAQFFSHHDLRYGFFNQPIIQRIGREFLKRADGEPDFGAMGNHRAWYGHTRLQNSLYLIGMGELDNDALFNIFVTALGVNNYLTQTEEQAYGHYLMLLEICSWMREVCTDTLLATSHYFPGKTQNHSLIDVRASWRMLARLNRVITSYPQVYEAMPSDMKEAFKIAEEMMDAYLHYMNPDRQWLINAHDALLIAQSNMDFQLLCVLNQRAFDAYTEENAKAIEAREAWRNPKKNKKPAKSA